VRGCLRAGRFTPAGHFQERLKERKIDMLDLHVAVSRCSIVESYSGMPRNGGTSWRLWGRDADGERTIAVGVEAFVAGDAEHVMLCTVFVKGEKT
jgi:hypothetical protein